MYSGLYPATIATRPRTSPSSISTSKDTTLTAPSRTSDASRESVPEGTLPCDGKGTQRNATTSIATAIKCRTDETGAIGFVSNGTGQNATALD